MPEAPEDENSARYDVDVKYQLEEFLVQEQGDETRGSETLMSASDHREDARHRDRHENQSLSILNMIHCRHADRRLTTGLEATTASFTPPVISSTGMNCIYRFQGWYPQEDGFHSIFCCFSWPSLRSSRTARG